MRILLFTLFLTLITISFGQTVDLDSIDNNYIRILAIQNWDEVVHISAEDESTEGGEINYYYNENKLEKISVDYFGEMGKSSKEFYLMNGKLSFVYEINHSYNRPIYLDSIAASENGETAFFDSKKSKITVKSTYIANGILLEQIPAIAFDSKIRKAEANRLMADFEKLLIKLESK